MYRCRYIYGIKRRMASPSTVGLQIRHLVMLFFLSSAYFSRVSPFFESFRSAGERRRQTPPEWKGGRAFPLLLVFAGLERPPKEEEEDPLFSPSPAKAARIPPAAAARGRGQNSDTTCCLTDFADEKYSFGDSDFFECVLCGEVF